MREPIHELDIAARFPDDADELVEMIAWLRAANPVDDLDRAAIRDLLVCLEAHLLKVVFGDPEVPSAGCL